MKIGFLVHRNIYFKYFSTLINGALKREYQVFLFHDYSQPKTGPKAYQFPLIHDNPFSNRAESLKFESNEELKELIKKKKLDAVVSLYYLSDYEPIRKSAGNIKWLSLQHGLDSIIQAQYLDYPNKYFLYTKEWLDLAKIFAKKDFKEERIEFSGFPELDQIQLVNREKVRQELGIPKGKKVVLFLPFPFNGSVDRFWVPFIYGMDNWFFQLPLSLVRKRYLRQVLNRENDKQLNLALGDFCSRNNAFLLVKARKKDKVRRYLRKIADKIIFDEEYYPSTIIKVMSIADLCCNFFSTAVTEAVPLGVPNLCIAPDRKDYKNLKHPLWEIILDKKRELFHFQGATYMLSIREAIQFFKKGKIEDFPMIEEKRKQYVSKFIGEFGASERVLDSLLKQENEAK